MIDLDCPDMGLGRPPKTLAEVAGANLLAASDKGGFLSQLRATKEAAEAVSTIGCLAIAHNMGAGEGGRWPTQYEYAAYWKVTLRRAEREWALVRRAFPGEKGPDRMAKIVALEFARRLESSGPGAAFSVPYAGEVALAA